jgi:hypothetical protein
MSQIVLTSLYNKLTASQGAGSVYALVSGRIFQIEAPQDVALPCLVFEVAGNDVEQYFNTTAKIRQELLATFTFFFPANAAASVSTAMTAEAALFLLLHRTGLTPSDASYTAMDTIGLTRGVPDIGKDFITVTSTFRIIAIKDT